MNKEYNYVEGNIIVKNENGKERVLNYQDNIDKILVKENIIEKIQYDIGVYNYALGVNEVTKYLKYNKNKYFLNFLLPTVIVPTIFACLNAGTFFVTIGTVIAVLQGAMLTICDIAKSKELENHINALKIIIEKDEKMLAEETKKLDELKKDNTKEINNQLKTDIQFKQSNETEMSNLSKLQQLYYVTGYDLKYLCKLDNKGTLDEFLHNEYNDNEIQIIREIVEKEGPVLVKTKGKK